MTPELLRRAGEALYGPQWRRAIAADLGITDRTIRRWIAGSFPIPAAVALELANICRGHCVAIEGIEAQMRGLSSSKTEQRAKSESGQ
jgi:predicted transcriptional regulator